MKTGIIGAVALGGFSRSGCPGPDCRRRTGYGNCNQKNMQRQAGSKAINPSAQTPMTKYRYFNVGCIDFKLF
jgi:hypothetical protein